MKLNELQNKRLHDIRTTVALTVIDPKLAHVEYGGVNRSARLDDCYSEVARAIRNRRVPDDATIIWYGHGKTPTHGVIVNNGEVVVDIFKKHLKSFDPQTLRLDYDVKGELGHGLMPVSKESVADFKEFTRTVYEEIKDKPFKKRQ